MNIRKTVEVVLLAAVALTPVVSFAIASERPAALAKSPIPAVQATEVHVVVVKAPRLPR